ncbi:hypothetical protein NFI96_000841 [Prochilodus magdalenae]|nr:hypothetical protein NFI96_000841 [Prochilodus magdalenae]
MVRTPTGPPESSVLVPGPSVLVPGPSVLVSGPSVLVPGPSVLVSGPSVLVPGPSVLVSGPSVLVPVPSVLVSGPSVLVSGPSVLVPGPSVLVPGPSVLVSGHSVLVPVPSVLVSGPSVLVPVPSVLVPGPSVLVPGPSVLVPGPSLGVCLSAAGMHSASPGSSDLGYLPLAYSGFQHLAAPEMGLSKGQPASSSHHLPGSSMTSSGCSSKRRKLMEMAGSDPLDYASSKPCQSWSVEGEARLPSTQLSPTALQPGPSTQGAGLGFTPVSVPSARTDTEGSCMEVEAAQRKLQEIEDRQSLGSQASKAKGTLLIGFYRSRRTSTSPRISTGTLLVEKRITLEDDSDEDLDVEPAQRRPVLVLSDSLREGLQRGIGDILPHTVTQSVSRSCMELVLWRPPEDPLTQQLKDTLQRQQRKQHPVSRQTPTPIPRSPLPEQLQPKEPGEQAFSPVYCPPVASSSGEEDMEL